MVIDKKSVDDILTGTSKSEIAIKSGLDLSHLCRILKGGKDGRVPNVVVFRKLAAALGLSMDTLYDKLYRPKRTRG
jgi:transcriptional regulator with XRE-family HTH domain